MAPTVGAQYFVKVRASPDHYYKNVAKLPGGGEGERGFRLTFAF